MNESVAGQPLLFILALLKHLKAADGRKEGSDREGGGRPLGVEEMRSDIGNKPMIGKECSCG